MPISWIVISNLRFILKFWYFELEGRENSFMIEYIGNMIQYRSWYNYIQQARLESFNLVSRDFVFLDSRIAFNRAWRINRNWLRNFQWRVAVILVDRITMVIDRNTEPSLDRLNPEPEHRENVWWSSSRVKPGLVQPDTLN